MGVKFVGIMSSGLEPASTSSDPQCAHWALLRGCEFLGLRPSDSEVAALLPIKNGGHSLSDIEGAMEGLGVATQRFSPPLTRAGFEGRVQILALHSPSHFVVAVGANDRGLHVFDNGERGFIAWQTLRRRSKGISLVLSGLISRAVDEPPIDGPRMSFDSLRADFGEIAFSNGTAFGSFSVTNSGDSDLVIHDVHASCSCVSLEFPKQPIPVGEAGVISCRVSLAAKSNIDLVSEDIIVRSNDPSRPVEVATISGLVRRRVRLSMERVDFGRVRRTDRREVFLLVETSLGAEEALLNVELSGIDGVTVEQSSIAESTSAICLDGRFKSQEVPPSGRLSVFKFVFDGSQLGERPDRSGSLSVVTDGGSIADARLAVAYSLID